MNLAAHQPRALFGNTTLGGDRMPLVAKASRTVFLKNLLIVAMCAVALGLFAYDGYYGYPSKNDRIVKQMLAMTDVSDGRMSTEFREDLATWKGWQNETDAARRRMDDIATAGAKVGQGIEGWKKVLDIKIQRGCVWGLAAAFVASLWWIIHCQRRRVIAEETTVSPAPGVVIPWDKITEVDNARWKSAGIVDITYTAADGTPRKAKFDDYEVERDPLIAILDQLAEKAVNAEFLPKEEPVPPSPPTPPTAHEHPGKAA